MTGTSRAVRIGALASALWFGVTTPLATALAQTDYPSRPVRIVTPLAAGSASDIVLRILAEKLSDHFNNQFVVQN
jgi:tripartite-type tricarboxylate transporter receptor subunit TctC